MAIIFLDPSLAAIPPHVWSSEQAEGVVRTLTEWSGALLRRPGVKFVMSADAPAALSLANCYPSGPNIRAMLDMFELSHVFSVRDIEQSINILLTRCDYIEEVLGGCVTTANIETHPDLGFSDLPDDISAVLRDTVAHAACVRSGLHEHGATIAAIGLSNHPGHSSLEIRATIEKCDHDGISKFIAGPFSIRASTHAPIGYRQLLLGWSSADLWRDALDAVDLHFALAVEAFNYLTKDAPEATPDQVKPFRIGPKFIASLKRCGAFAGGVFSSVVRNACTKILVDSSTLEVRAFRVSRYSSEQKVRIDKARAWRVHVTKSHEGLRLMYWTLACGTIEFANIGPKHEEEIEEAVDTETSDLAL